MKNIPALDHIIHEASRLTLVAVLKECKMVDFNFLLSATGMSRGNLSTHMSKLVDARYVKETKEFVNRKPHTTYELSPAGTAAYKKYLKDWKHLTGKTKKS
ncbi:transcriptional regulator [Planctomycetota bacterium]